MIDQKIMMDLVMSLGYELAMSGAEIYRIEDSVVMILQAYGLDGQCFAIPNCLIITIVQEDGTPMTQMRRIGLHGNNLDAVEKLSALSRSLCSRRPEPGTAIAWLQQTKQQYKVYSTPWKALGYFLGAFGFSMFFGGTLADALGAGLCGLVILAVDWWGDQVKSTVFFRTILAAFLSAMAAYLIFQTGLIDNADGSIIGALMLLVPGLLFTNAMRDVMYGDTNSGLNRVVQVLLIAVAIALGTAAALQITTLVFGEPVGKGLIDYGPIWMNVHSFIGTLGFIIYFNIHGPGSLLCAVGGVLSWSTYLITVHYTNNVVLGNLTGGLVASVFAEVMARVRKYPAICYLVVSIFPLIPGAGVYYTMLYAVRGDMANFASKGFETAAIAGAIALGILLVSTAFRIWSLYQRRKR